MARVGASIRSKPHLSQDICADCGALDPSWASINRGILICDECCSVHRSLGRHISHVKSLKKGSWHPSQLSMVHTLNSSGANHVWEHTLLDPSSAKVLRRKPQPKDPVHPTKADFIRGKHQMMSFVFRPNKEETANDDADADVSCQLHASVRTRNVEISLRLLTQGADPNYFHLEKGNCPLHVAARAGQVSQIELLVIYGADPGGVDQEGKTPAQYARDAGYHDIATRLVEFQYEVTDRLAFYLCGRKPDHTLGQHWIIPEVTDSLESNDGAMEARFKLIALPNHSFEELACDVFDEVDRRETDSIWLSLQNQSALISDGCSVPFLPVNPDYSSTRNQGRQKLARFNAREFATLIIDILVESRRRSVGGSPSFISKSKDSTSNDVTVTPIHLPQLSTLTTNNTKASSPKLHVTNRQTCPSNGAKPNLPISMTSFAQSQPSLNTRPKDSLYDDEPLYDSVASEDDYSSWERRRKIQHQQEILSKQSVTPNDIDYQQVTESSNRTETKLATAVSLEEYLDMKRHLEVSETRIRALQDNNIVMSAKLNHLSSMVNTLKEENDTLRYHHPPSHYTTPNHSTPPPHRNYPPTFYDSPTHSLQNGDGPCRSPKLSDGVNLGSATSIRQQRPYSMFESRGRNNSHGNHPNDSFNHHVNVNSHDSGSMKSVDTSIENLSLMEGLPSQEEVVRKTEVITKKIQELLISAQETQHERFIPCSGQINGAVKEMALLFPKVGCPPEISNAVQQLVLSAARLHSECRNHVTSQLHVLDPGRVTQQVIQCAYDIAKAAKVLVTHFQ